MISSSVTITILIASFVAYYHDLLSYMHLLFVYVFHCLDVTLSLRFCVLYVLICHSPSANCLLFILH